MDSVFMNSLTPKIYFNPQINVIGTFTVIYNIGREAKYLNHPKHKFPAETEQGNTLPSCLSPQALKKCPF